MANRITHELNIILGRSGAVSDFYSRRYLTEAPGQAVKVDRAELSSCAIDMYYRLNGYELFGSAEENARKLSSVAAEIVGTAGVLGTEFSYSIFNRDRMTKVFFGTNHECAQQIKRVLSGNLPNANVSNEWITPRDLAEIQRYNGVVVGVSELESGKIDELINSLQQDDYLLSVVLVPIRKEDIDKEIERIHLRRDELQRVSKRELTIGSNRVRRFDNDNHEALEALDVMNRELQRLKKGAVSGLWYAAVYISSDLEEHYYRAAAMTSALFRKQSNTGRDAAGSTFHSINYAPVTHSVWRVPTAFLGTENYGGIYGNSLLNICELSCAAGLAAIPACSHAGYYVKHFGSSASAAGAFEQYPTMPQRETRRFVIGKTEGGNEYYLPLDGLKQHAFITGATQYGKSTSIRKILVEASRFGIPFVVIEAAKKEYWELKKCPGMESLRVFSNGMDARELFINPFQPEENTVLDSHIQSLIQAFLSLFDQADPLPQILTELIYTCYEKKGWDVSRRVSAASDLEYPTLSDMLTNLNECIDGIGYSDEVRDNMKGVIRIRVSSLIRQAGRALNTTVNLSVSEMFRHSAIIELDDFSDRNKPFVASLIAMKASEYSKQCATWKDLKRLLIIEEAHHIIPNPEQKSVSSNAALCSKYFSNMLAEVSAYGTGVAIIDQRPSAVSSSAIANTGFKLIHNIHEREDLEAASASLALRSHEEGVLPKLHVGEALVTVPQTNEVSRVRIDGIVKKTEPFNLGLLFCDRCDCDVSMLISEYDLIHLGNKEFSAGAVVSCVRSIRDRNPHCLRQEDLICLAGALIERAPVNVMMKRQRLFEAVDNLSRWERDA